MPYSLREVMGVGLRERARRAAAPTSTMPLLDAHKYPDKERALAVQQYLMFDHPDAFDFRAEIAPGRRVMDRAYGRVGTVVEGGREPNKEAGEPGWFYPAVQYDGETFFGDVKDTSLNVDYFVVIRPDKEPLPARPWS